MIHPVVPRAVTIFAMKQLANVDYSVATRVSEDVSRIVTWSYQNDQPWLAQSSIELLQYLDTLGSFLITIVVFIVHHTK